MTDKKKILNIRETSVPELEDEGDETNEIIANAQREAMLSVARGLDEAFNGNARGNDRAIGFVLLTFPFGEYEETPNYVSNGAEREEILTLLEAALARAIRMKKNENSN